MLIDWTKYQSELLSRIKDLGRHSPETLAGYQKLSKAGETTRHLDAKTRELIALACAVTSRCDGCIAVHVDAAVKLGATSDEVSEALGVAIALAAGAALVYSARTLDSYEARVLSQAGGTTPANAS